MREKHCPRRSLQCLEVHQSTGKSPRVPSQSPKSKVQSNQRWRACRCNAGVVGNPTDDVRLVTGNVVGPEWSINQSEGMGGTNQYEKIINHGLSTIYYAGKNSSALKNPIKNDEKEIHRKEYMASDNRRERDDQHIVPSLDVPPERHHIGREYDHHGDARKAYDEGQLEALPDS